ncbi:MAG TPA: DUF58 domain-containing protein [Geobacterales bacterium]|nr:DUF58 domain-containing protein [Geobacterales bacterium]
MINFTKLGKLLFSIDLSSILISLFFSNYYLLAIFIISFFILIYDYLDARKILTKPPIEIMPNRLSKSVIRGEVLHMDLKFKSKRNFEPVNTKEFKIEKKNDTLSIQLNADRIGTKVLNEIKIKMPSKLKLFNIETSAKLELEIRIKPKIVAIAMEILGILEGLRKGRGGMMMGETVSRFIGHGFEYLGSREYHPGDDLRRIDWKATARRFQLMIKEFHREMGGRIGLIYSNYNIGPNTNDDMVSDFLLILLNAAKEDIPVKVTMIENGQIIDIPVSDPTEILAICLDRLLKYSGVSYEEIYQIIEEDPYFRDFKLMNLERFQEFVKLSKEKVMRDAKIGKNFMSFFEPENSNETEAIIIFSSLIKDSRLISSSALMMRFPNVRLYIAYHSKPWLDAKNLEEAYLMYKKMNSVLNYLTKIGCETLAVPILKPK